MNSVAPGSMPIGSRSKLVLGMLTERYSMASATLILSLS
jgi:hypothetical protein